MSQAHRIEELMQQLKKKYTIAIVTQFDPHFAMTRCGSGGDLNCRSSLAFSALEEGQKSGRFRPEFAGRSLGEQFSDRL